MKSFEKLSGIVVRRDGKEVKFTLHVEHMKPTEIAVGAEDLEALTVQFLRLAVECGRLQGKPSAATTGADVETWPVQVDNFGVMPSGYPGESLLVIPLGLFQLGFSMPSEQLRAGAQGLANIGLSMEQEPRNVQ